MGKLDGKVALIVGASPNNGGTAAHFMAREGAKIVASDINEQTNEETVSFLKGEGYDAVAIPGDGTDHDDVERVVKAAMDHYGQIDILLNMAGRGGRAAVWEVSKELWETVGLKGHLAGAVWTTKHVALAMMSKNIQGSIIHIASDAAHQGESGNALYSGQKAGVMNFARAAAMDLSLHGIRVNTISPTYIEHNLWRFGPMAPQQNQPAQPAQPDPLRVSAEDFLQGIPLGRFARASDVANVAVWLGSDESSFITAVDIPVDGGAGRKYWPWRPTNQNVDDYVKKTQKTRFGQVN